MPGPVQKKSLQKHAADVDNGLRGSGVSTLRVTGVLYGENEGVGFNARIMGSKAAQHKTKVLLLQYCNTL